MHNIPPNAADAATPSRSARVSPRFVVIGPIPTNLILYFHLQPPVFETAAVAAATAGSATWRIEVR